MQTNSQINVSYECQGNFSTFFNHVERRKALHIFGAVDAELDFCEFLIRTELR
jgi:hypothetical protein